MAGVLSFIKERLNVSNPQIDDSINSNDKIALGVLLWVVAEADGKFEIFEIDKIKEILKNYSKITPVEMSTVLESIKIANQEKIDLFSFTHEVAEGLTRDQKKEIIANLFRVGFADDDLDQNEHEVIRKISDLFRLDHREFIDQKVLVKKELGLPTFDSF